MQSRDLKLRPSLSTGSLGSAPFPGLLKAIVLDVDGTLYNQGPVRRAMAGALLRATLTNPRKQLEVIRLLRSYRDAQENLRDLSQRGDLRELQLEYACERSGIAPSIAAEIVQDWMFTLPLPHIRRAAKEGMVDFVHWARANSLALGIYSDYPAEAKLEALGLGGFFDSIVCSSDPEIGRFKPDPKGLLQCLRDLGVSPESSVFVGDRQDADGGCARAAGVHAAILVKRPQEDRPGITFFSGFQNLISLCIAQDSSLKRTLKT